MISSYNPKNDDELNSKKRIYHYDSSLVNIGASLNIPRNNNLFVITLSRYGRSTSICATAHSIITCSNGAKLLFGEDLTAYILLKGNESNNTFTLTTPISGLSNVYITIVEFP